VRCLWYKAAMSDLISLSHASETPCRPTEYERLMSALCQIISETNSVIDLREDKWQIPREQLRTRNEEAAYSGFFVVSSDMISDVCHKPNLLNGSAHLSRASLGFGHTGKIITA